MNAFGPQWGLSCAQRPHISLEPGECPGRRGWLVASHAMRFLFPCSVLTLFVFLACHSSSVAPPSQAAPSMAAPSVAAPNVAAPPVRLDWAKSEQGGALPPQLTGTDGVGLALVSLEAQV